jgi:predicted esterase
MTLSRLWRVVLVVAGLVPSMALAGNVFDLGAKTADRAVVTVAEDNPGDAGPTSPMLDLLQGVLARLDKAQILELRAAGGGTGALVQPGRTAARLCVVHLFQGTQAKHVEVLRDEEGVYFAQELVAEGLSGPAVPKARATKLIQGKFAGVCALWPGYRGEFKLPKESPKAGQVAQLSRPYTPGWFIVDKPLMGERFNGGHQTNLEIETRDLSSEPLLVRLPKDYDPRRAYGVLVYIDPGDNASIYQPFHAAADELGFIMVAAVNTGNEVHRAIRYQLALDGLATVSERYLVDPRRVYPTGISGGGQISTHLWLCMPDLFTGAVPIVALASYENIPADFGKYWMATVAKPTAKLLKMAQAHRCGAMTGGKDFNEKIIQDAAKLLVRDGFKVQVYDYPDMGHTAPKAERFAEALKWVDEPYRTIRDREIKAAEDALAKVTSNTALTGEARRAALVEVTKVGPWTTAAWKAAEMLGVAPQ